MLIQKPKVLELKNITPISIVRPAFGMPDGVRLPVTNWIAYLDTGKEVRKFFLYKRNFQIQSRVRDTTPFLYGISTPTQLGFKLFYHWMRGNKRKAGLLPLEVWAKIFNPLNMFMPVLRFYKGLDWSKVFGPAVSVPSLANGGCEDLFDAGDYWANEYGMARVKTLDQPSIITQHIRNLRVPILKAFGKYLMKCSLRGYFYEQIIGEPGYYTNIVGKVTRHSDFIISKCWFAGGNMYMLKISPQNKYITISGEDMRLRYIMDGIFKAQGVYASLDLVFTKVLNNHWKTLCLLDEAPPDKGARQLFFF